MSQNSFRKAVKWSYVTQGTEQGVNTALTFVLAYLLGPRDFGIAAMAMAYILFIKLILEQGLVAAIIQRSDLQPEHLDSAFCLNLGLSVLLVGVSISASGWWASVNHTPLLGPVICVLSLSIPLEGLTSVQRALLQRDLDFRSLAIRSFISLVAGGLLGLGLALKGFGVWALVGKQLGTDLVGLVALWKLTHWRPRLKFHLGSMKQLLHFSSGAFLGNLGLFFNTQADALLLGLFFGPVPVGLYRLADKVVKSVVTVALASLQVAAYPNFCRLQNKTEELRASFLDCVRAGSILTIPALAGLAVMSPLLVSALGPKWADTADALRILAVIMMVCPVSNFLGPLLQAVSKPHSLAVIEWAHAIISAGSLVVAGEVLKHSSTWGQVTGMAVTRILTTAMLMAPLVFWLLPKYVGLRPSSIAKTMMPSLCAGAGTALAAYLACSFTASHILPRWPSIAMVILVGGLAGSAILLSLDHNLRKTVTQSLIRT